MSCSLAHETALRMLGLLPEPEMASSRSPGEARFFSCSTKMRSYPSSLAQAMMPGGVVGQAQDPQPLLVFKVAQGALRQVFAEMRGIRARAAVADDEDEPALVVGGFDQLTHLLGLGRSSRLISSQTRAR